MTNGDRGGELAMEILRAIAREYDFPRFQPIVRDTVGLEAEALAAFAGDYFSVSEDAPPGPIMQLRLDQGVLRADVPPADWMDRTLHASSEGTFFFLENQGEIAFDQNESGTVVGAIVSGLGDPIRSVRR